MAHRDAPYDWHVGRILMRLDGSIPVQAGMIPVAAVPAHAAALAAIHALAFPLGERWEAEAMGVQLVQPGGFGFVAEAGGFVLARVAADEAEVLTLAVAPAARRRGLGRALLRRAMVEAAGRGAASMVLEVGAANAPALALYAAAGFGAVGLRRGYYGAGADALVMRAVLGPVLP